MLPMCMRGPEFHAIWPLYHGYHFRKLPGESVTLGRDPEALPDEVRTSQNNQNTLTPNQLSEI